MTAEGDEAVGPLDAELHLLHDDYVRAVSSALEQGRDDLVRELTELYPDEALALMAGSAPR